MRNSPFFLPYQSAWIRDKSRIKLIEKSRQIGMSWATAYALVRRHWDPRNTRDSWVSSRDELQAKLFIGDCKKFADVLDIAAREHTGADFVEGADSRSLEFSNGTRIWSLSSSPDAQAGKRGTRVLDEFALHPDPELLYSVAYPGTTWGGNLEIISTHRGKDNFFNKLVEEARFGGNPKNISLHRVTLADALDQGFLKKLKESLGEGHEVFHMDEAEYFDHVKNSCADSESFLQEYMCEPSDDSSAFVPYEAVERCIYAHGEDWRSISSPDNPAYLGVDVGRSRDLSVFWLLEKSADIFFTRDIKVFRNTPFSEQEAVLFDFMRNPNLRRAAIDQSGLGRQFAERAAERYGAGRVEGISFTAASKEELAYPLRRSFEDARIRIPDDPEVRADIRSVKRESNSFGGVRFRAERSPDGHADRFWALALALWAGRASSRNAEVELVEKRQTGFVW